MRKIFIHCGLHKTGTTALQTALFKNRKELSLQNFHYPEKGIPLNHSGHHNLAWQLSRDRRFRSHYGDFKSLSSDIESTKGSIILSSEDFECSLLYPHKWRRIQEYFEIHNINIVFVIYLRNHINYIESLYAELLQAGMGEEYAIFTKRIISNKNFTFRDWEFIFNYSEILNSMKKLKNVQIIFRNYDDLIADNVVDDFCDAVGLRCNEFTRPPIIDQINKRQNLNTLLKMFFKNRAGQLPSNVSEIIDALCNGKNGSLTSPIQLKNIINKIRDECPLTSSQKFKRQDVDTSKKLNLRKIFSLETHLLILNLQNSNSDHHVKNTSIEKWRSWIDLKDEGK